jgi:hypothetical protein
MVDFSSIKRPIKAQNVPTGTALSLTLTPQFARREEGKVVNWIRRPAKADQDLMHDMSEVEPPFRISEGVESL